MKDGELILDGKKYISSTRAAQLVGYTKDYVGQLARAGKLDCKLIGRGWYIAEDSITKHKLEVHYTLTKPKKPRKQDREQKVSFHEKHSSALDISPKQDFPKRPPSFAEINLNDDLDLYESDNRALYPEPKRATNPDVLLHSDIRFESPDIDVTEKDEKTNENNVDLSTVSSGRTQRQVVHTGIIPIRRPAQSEVTSVTRTRVDPYPQQHIHVKNYPSIMASPMDGIVPASSPLSARKKNAASIDDDTYMDDDEYLYDDNNDAVEEVREHQRGPKRRRGSRAVPVIASVIVFIILAAVYAVL